MRKLIETICLPSRFISAGLFLFMSTYLHVHIYGKFWCSVLLKINTVKCFKLLGWLSKFKIRLFQPSYVFIDFISWKEKSTMSWLLTVHISNFPCSFLTLTTWEKQNVNSCSVVNGAFKTNTSKSDFKRWTVQDLAKGLHPSEDQVDPWTINNGSYGSGQNIIKK